MMISALSAILVMQNLVHDIKYPETERTSVIEQIHGREIADPYRWLEDGASEKTKAWIDAQNKVTFGYLNTIPERASILNRLTKLWDYERRSAPFIEGGKRFFSKNDGLQNQAVLYVQDSPNAEPRKLLDPNALSKDGTVALSGMGVSRNGKYLAYSTSVGGSDWQEWHVLTVADGKKLSDNVKWSKFSGASWDAESKGFYYSRYDEPKSGEKLQGANYHQKVYYHKLGDPQSSDRLVHERKDQPEWGLSATVSDDGRYLIITVWKGTDPKVGLFYKDLKARSAKFIELYQPGEAAYEFVANRGGKFFIKSDKDAPLGKVITVELATRKETVIVPEGKDAMQSVTAVGNKLFITYLHDAHTVVFQHDLNGKKEKPIALPGLGTAAGFGGKLTDRETYYTFTSFTYPATVFKLEVGSGKQSTWFAPKVQAKPELYETKQVFYNSKDGTRVPMFLTHKKGIKLDGSNPTLLYGYGGFNAAMTPWFSVTNTVWLEMGGVYAVACIRGGSEYGEEWHQAGTKLKKQNVFEDFIAAAEWLIDNKYTSSSKLAINGASNGGLLVGAVLNQRPELFGAAVPEVGVLDMLRFHRFTIGWAWVSDYGSPDDPKEFEALLAYSPYHNIRAGVAYPPILVTTGDHDDRVVPAHSFKYAAALQAAHPSGSPKLIRIETSGGHGAGKPTAKIIAERSDVLGFLLKSLGMSLPADFGT